MPSLRDVKKHISAVTSIKQITYAMKMVAAARIKKAQDSIIASRPYAIEMGKLMSDLYGEFTEEDCLGKKAELFFAKRQKGEKVLLLITADKGLCGAFNTSVMKAAIKWIRANMDSRVHVLAVGKKGIDLVRRLKKADVQLYSELAGIFPKAKYAHAEMLYEKLFELFQKPEIQNVTMIYNTFVSRASQAVIVKELLPLTDYIENGAGKTEEDEKKGNSEFFFEPEKSEIFDALIPRHITVQIYRALLESQAAELAARMSAMEAASENASELIEGLTLKMNKTRQSIITTELTEIVSGAEALGN